MVGQLLHICEIACGLMAACSAVVAAWFEYCERRQTSVEREETKASYGKKWAAIRDSGLLELPEKAITLTLDAKTRFAKAVGRRVRRLLDEQDAEGTWLIGLSFLVPFVGGAVGGWIAYGWLGAIALASAPGVILARDGIHRIMNVESPEWETPAAMGLLATACLLTAGLWLKILLDLDIAQAAGAMFILLPVYMIVLTISLLFVGMIGSETTTWDFMEHDFWMVFGMATAVSFLVTLCSLLVGSMVAPDAWIPKTLRMLLCNVAFDGLTMVATFAILARAVGEKRRYPIPVAILIDVAVAALFACASLWLGLIGTEPALSVGKVLGVLVARSTEETAPNALGPYFWVMHTTFLPTLGYLGVILLFWVAKLVVLPVARVLKKGGEIEKPHSMTAGLFGFVGAVALVAAGVLHVANSFVPNPPLAAPAQVVEDGA